MDCVPACPALSAPPGPSPSRCGSPPTLGQADMQELWERSFTKLLPLPSLHLCSHTSKAKWVICSEQVNQTIKSLFLFVDL